MYVRSHCNREYLRETGIQLSHPCSDQGEADILDFPQPGFEAPTTDSDPLPTVEVLYPAKGCTEKFVLLVPPGGAFEYNPVAELKSVLTAILDREWPCDLKLS